MAAIVANLQYAKRLKLYEVEKPFQSFIEIPEDASDKRPTNLEFEEKEETITNIRDMKSSFQIDCHGFMIREDPLEYGAALFSNKKEVEMLYFPRLEKIIAETIGYTDKVMFFDWRLRSANVPYNDTVIDLYDPTAWLRPANRVHVDQSPAAVLHRIMISFPDEAEKLLRGRVRILNFWRPIAYPAQDYPLAVCDSRSITGGDFLECDHIRRKYVGSTLFAVYREGYNWYYLEDQNPNELLIMKMFDSDCSVAQNCPHVAFKHPESNESTPPRQSIEVRALVFNYD